MVVNISEPSVRENAKGTMPKIIASVVIKMALLLTKPINITTPMTENIDKVELKISSNSSTPIKVSGSANISAVSEMNPWSNKEWLMSKLRLEKSTWGPAPSQGVAISTK